tara:strand:- start:30696 stop:31670 length:975 start_codon:yes stop_codon:yes gene_type:complete
MTQAGAAMTRLPINGESRTFAVQLMRDLVVPTFVLDATGHVLIWNNALAKLTGITAEHVIGTRNHWQGFYKQERPCLADLVLEGNFKAEDWYAEVRSSSKRERRISAENWCNLPRSRSSRYLAIDAGPIFSDKGELLAVVETLRDITEQKRAEDELVRLAHLDGLTGIANRRSFDRHLKTHWDAATKTGEPLSILLIDIDHFKSFNDSLGHQAGDECLRDLAKLLASCLVSPEDMAARYGGEEFAIVLPSTDADGACIVAERIRSAIRRLAIGHPASPTSSFVSVSIGTASVRSFQKSVDKLIALADGALYLAKRDGRNQVIQA